MPVPLSIAPLRLLCFSMQQQQAPSRTSIWHCQDIWCLMTGTKLGPVYSPFGKTACGFVDLEIQGAREQGRKDIYVQTVSIFSSFWYCALPLPRFQNIDFAVHWYLSLTLVILTCCIKWGYLGLGFIIWLLKLRPWQSGLFTLGRDGFQVVQGATMFQKKWVPVLRGS